MALAGLTQTQYSISPGLTSNYLPVVFKLGSHLLCIHEHCHQLRKDKFLTHMCISEDRIITASCEQNVYTDFSLVKVVGTSVPEDETVSSITSVKERGQSMTERSRC